MSENLEIELIIKRWDRRFSYGISSRLVSPIYSDERQYAPEFENAMELSILGTAKEVLGRKNVSVRVDVYETNGPEPEAHDQKFVDDVIAIGRVDLETQLNVMANLSRGAIITLHHILTDTEAPSAILSCLPFGEGLSSNESQADLLWLSIFSELQAVKDAP